MSLKEVRYYIEHQLLPELFFEQKSDFIDAMLDEERNLLYECMTKICEEENIPCPYKEEQYKIDCYKIGENEYMIKAIFPTPEETPLCSKVYFMFDEEFNNIQYFTVERDQVKGKKQVYHLCGWDEEHNHLNYGQAPNGIKALDNTVVKYYLNIQNAVIASKQDTGNTSEHHEELIEAIKRYFEEIELNYYFEEQGAFVYPLELNGKIDRIESSICVDEYMITAVSFLPFKVSPEKIPIAMEFVVRANNMLNQPKFGLDIEEGEISYIECIQCEKTIPDFEDLEEMVFTPEVVIEFFSEALVDVMQGAKTPKEAIDMLQEEREN